MRKGTLKVSKQGPSPRRKSSAAGSGEVPAILRFSLRGQHVYTTMETLMARGDNKLTQLAQNFYSGRPAACIADDDHMFLDRDADVFKKLLQYLSGVQVQHDAELKRLMKDYAVRPPMTSDMYSELRSLCESSPNYQGKASSRSKGPNSILVQKWWHLLDPCIRKECRSSAAKGQTCLMVAYQFVHAKNHIRWNIGESFETIDTTGDNVMFELEAIVELMAKVLSNNLHLNVENVARGKIEISWKEPLKVLSRTSPRGSE